MAVKSRYYLLIHLVYYRVDISKVLESNNYENDGLIIISNAFYEYSQGYTTKQAVNAIIQSKEGKKKKTREPQISKK